MLKTQTNILFKIYMVDSNEITKMHTWKNFYGIALGIIISLKDVMC